MHSYDLYINVNPNFTHTIFHKKQEEILKSIETHTYNQSPHTYSWMVISFDSLEILHLSLQ